MGRKRFCQRRLADRFVAGIAGDALSSGQEYKRVNQAGTGGMRMRRGIGRLLLGAGLSGLLVGCGIDLTGDADIPLNTTAQSVAPASLSPPPTPPRQPEPPARAFGGRGPQSFALANVPARVLMDTSRHPGITGGPIGASAGGPPLRLQTLADATDDAAPGSYVPFGQGDVELPPEVADEVAATAPPDVRSIVGYPEDELRRLLGEPNTIEERPPAFTWQYASETCTLDLTFFLEVGTNTYRVLSYDLQSRREDVSDVDRRCLVELLQSASSS